METEHGACRGQSPKYFRIFQKMCKILLGLFAIFQALWFGHFRRLARNEEILANIMGFWTTHLKYN